MNDDSKISRKDLLKKSLKYGAGSVLLTGGAGVGYSALGNSNFKREFPVVPGNKVKLPPSGKSVLILGGGLAGLQAGCELTDRGFQVTVLEKSRVPGGKLKAWKDKNFARKYFGNEGYTREHGLHAVWGFYKNLREFMGRHGMGLNKLPPEESFYYFINSQGVQNKLNMSRWPVPFGRFQMVSETMYIPSEGNVHRPAPGQFAQIKSQLKLWGFNFLDKDQRLYMDGMTFYDWGKKAGMSDQFIKHYYGAMSEMAFFMSPKECSALAVANLMRLGAVPRDSIADFFKWPPDDTVINPMVEHIRKGGGKIIYDNQVTGLETKDGRVIAAHTNQHIPAGRVRRCRVCGNIVTGSGHEHCPFCGAHVENLTHVKSSDRIPGRYTADYYVTAMDVPGARELILRSRLEGDPYFKRITQLTHATILCVNLLYENTDAWEKRFPPGGRFQTPDFMPTGFKLLGFTTNWSSRQIPHLRKKRVDLIEVQVSNWKELGTGGFRAFAMRVHEELKRVIPGLPTPSDSYVNLWNNYTGFRPGDERNRPVVQSPLDNLMFIGDWVFVPQHSIFMERTNVTAKYVTNMIMDKAGVSGGRLEILHSGVPDWQLDLLGMLTSVRV